MLYVDGMNGIIAHNTTIQWLYELLDSPVSSPSGRLSVIVCASCPSSFVVHFYVGGVRLVVRRGGAQRNEPIPARMGELHELSACTPPQAPFGGALIGVEVLDNPSFLPLCLAPPSSPEHLFRKLCRHDQLFI